MHELKSQIDELKTRFESFLEGIDLAKKKKDLEILTAKSSKEDLWDNQEEAKNIMQDLGDLQSEVKQIDDFNDEITALSELAEEGELSKSLKEDISRLEKTLKQMELSTFLSGKYDKKNAIVSLHAGQGGTEAMDWTSMLFRMYMRFFERRDWKYKVLDEASGEEAGLKSVIFEVNAPYAYGYLKREAGTHRLVRQSPFNADKLRQTSFSLVDVMPKLEDVDEPDIELKDEDLDWQFYRSGGHGGQNVNKVSTAVRLTHKPSGIVVTAQTERKQEQNRANALSLLKSKLWLKKQEELEKEKQKISGDYTPATWGTQIRSYVLHPYKMIKDLRTEVETSDTDAVLDGDLDEFIEAELKL